MKPRANRRRLYDIDVVINKALVYGALAAFITAVYVAIVVGIGSVVGSADEPNLGLQIASTAVVAVAFQPMRERVQRFANGLVYGSRATPYEVMAGFSRRVAGALSVHDVLREMAEGLRDLARGIFPPLLADRGIVPALQAHVRKVRADAAIVASPGFADERFDPDAEATVYFCCLQAIQNVVRHAGNARTIVRLDRDADDAVVFSVRDEGPGFDPERVPRGMGFDIMHDRMEALGGELEVVSSPGAGTTVTGRVPARTIQAVPS